MSLKVCLVWFRLTRLFGILNNETLVKSIGQTHLFQNPILFDSSSLCAFCTLVSSNSLSKLAHSSPKGCEFRINNLIAKYNALLGNKRRVFPQNAGFYFQNCKRDPLGTRRSFLQSLHIQRSSPKFTKYSFVKFKRWVTWWFSLLLCEFTPSNPKSSF